MQLRARDATAALEFAGALAECDSASDFRMQVTDLRELVGAETALVIGCRNWGEDVLVEAGDLDAYAPVLGEEMSRDWLEHPVAKLDMRAPTAKAHRLSDFCDIRAWRRGKLFNGLYRGLRMANEISVQVGFGPIGSSCCLVLHRGGRDFSERDIAVVDALGPHLRATRTRITLMQRAAAAPVAVAPQVLANRLPISEREAQVLAVLADGSTNDGIAQQLGISRHTVIRHVERIYAKLDVHTRAGATRKALEACTRPSAGVEV
jgi:DNA-binding CsgD family transcriptional regulator